MADTKTHWKKLRNNDYLGSWALEPGQDMTAAIKLIRVERVTGADGKAEECTVMHFSDPGVKPMVLNATNQKTMEKLFKTPYIEEWAGRRVQIGVEKVKAFGDVHDALRIRPFLPKENGDAKCTHCGTVITATANMNAARVVAWTQNKFGRILCAACVEDFREKTKAQAQESQEQNKEEQDDAADE